MRVFISALVARVQLTTIDYRTDQVLCAQVFCVSNFVIDSILLNSHKYPYDFAVNSVGFFSLLSCVCSCVLDLKQKILNCAC